MKVSATTVACAALALALTPDTGLAQTQQQQQSPAAQTHEAPVIAVLDVNEVLQRSKAGKNIQPQFDKLKKGYEDELNKEQQTLQGEIQQLESQRAVLAPEAFAQRANALRQREQSLINRVNEKKRILDATLQGGLGQIRNVMFQVTADIARERSLNMVLPKEMVVIIAKNLEITDEVLKRVDERLPTVALKVTQPSGAAPPAAAAPQPAQQRPPAQRSQPAQPQQRQQQQPRN
jgi:Skp family chaperone for outer membrane proteins